MQKRILSLVLALALAVAAFAGCTSLTSIRIPKEAQVADDAFAGCPAVPIVE